MIPRGRDSAVRIMIVEDESIVVQDLEVSLTHLGYEVIGIHASGEAALRAAAEKPPDLVLMDILLAGALDGVEAAERLRRDFDIPVVFVTAYADAGLLERAKAASPYGYVLKPFDLRELRSAVEVALHRYDAEREVRLVRDEWEATFEAVPDQIMIIGEDYRIRRINRAMADGFGMEPAEAVGRFCYEVIHGGSSPPSFCPHPKVRDDGRIHATEVRLPRLDRDFLITVSPIYDAEGRMNGAVHVARDITDRKRLEKQREEFYEEIKDALARTRRPGNLIRVCSTCLKVSGYGGEWHRLDHYLDRHHDGRFSTAICPDCLREGDKGQNRPSPQRDPGLSPREREVLGWLAQGKSNWEIARILGVRERTVKYHIGNIKEKLGVSTRIQAVVEAIQSGILEGAGP